MKIMSYKERGVDGERRNAENLLRRFEKDFKENILQITRDKVYQNFSDGAWKSTSDFNEVFIVPIGEGRRVEQYLVKLANIVGDEFSSIGFNSTRNLQGETSVGVGFIGKLTRILDAAFCSVHILSTLRILYGTRDREKKRGYLYGLEECGFGGNKIPEALESCTRVSKFFGIYVNNNRRTIAKGEKFFEGFADGQEAGKAGKFSKKGRCLEA